MATAANPSVMRKKSQIRGEAIISGRGRHWTTQAEYLIWSRFLHLWRRPHSRVMRYSNVTGGRSPFRDLLGLAPWVQHGEGKWCANEKSHEILPSPCLVREDNEFWKILIFDAFIENLSHTEPRGPTVSHGTRASSNSVQSATSVTKLKSEHVI